MRRTHTARIIACIVTLALVAIGSPLVAQQVVVFDAFPPVPGSADNTEGQRRGVNQRVLVVPVITQATAYDPENNLLSTYDPLRPNLRQELVDKFVQVNDFWIENSFGEVSLNVTVLERFYQMPRDTGHYFNPAYVAPRLTGTAIVGPNVTVPTGQVRLHVHITPSDQTMVDLAFDAAASPYTFDAIQTAIGNALAIVGDKVSLSLLADCGVNCRRLRFEVPQIYTRAGTFVHVDFTASNAAVLDALGLDRPVVELATPRLTGRGAELPYTPTAGQSLTLTVDNGVDAPESYAWTMGAAAINSPAGFIATHGATHPQVTITAVSGELRFTVAPTIAGPYRSLVMSGPAELLDRLGLDASVEQDGTINFSARNTIKGDRRYIAGQAIAAYMLNELTRSPAAPGPDPFPNTPITAANEATLRALFQAEIDPYRMIAVIFLDAPNKRAGASGGYIPIGIEQGGYRFVHVTKGSIQIQYDFSSAMTIAHETGHNIGFIDLYNNSNGEYDPALRYPIDWDVMHAEGLFPHTGAWHKEVDNGWLSATGANVAVMAEPGTTGVSDTRTYVLTPLELPAASYDNALAGVPAGRTVTKLIRLPIGLGESADDHFLLVQNRQRGPSFGQSLPQHPAAAARGGVYITDAISRKSFDFFKPTTRNFAHPLTDSPLLPSSNVRPIIDRAPDPDFDMLMSYPAYDGVDVEIVGELAGPGAFADRPAYLVNVTREQKGFLDLGITPWGAPPWESPDIWIEHGNKAVLSNVPLPGNGEPTRWAVGYSQAANGGVPLNWIRTRVTNSGTVDATDVQIRVRVNTPGGMGDSGTWTILGLSEPVDIPAGESRILQVGWNPSVNRHTCVEVEVFRWTSVLGDRNPWNNVTQENVNLFQPTSSSPWEATPFEFEIANGRSFPMDVMVQPEALPPGYIVTLEQPFVHVPANSSVTVEGLLELDEAIIPPFGGAGGAGGAAGAQLDPRTTRPPQRRVDMFHLNGYVVGDEYQVPAGGLTFVVLPSRRVDLDASSGIDANGNIVVTGTTSPPVGGITVEAELRYPSGRFDWVSIVTDGTGGFRTTIPPEEEGEVRVTVRIPPGQTAAPTDAGVDLVDTRQPRPALRPLPPGLDLFFGGMLTDRASDLDAGLDWGFRYRHAIARGWGIEAEVGTAETDSGVNDGLLVRGQLHIVRRLVAGGRAQPFVLVGAGIAHFDGRGRSDTAALLTAGLGADVFITARLGFRVDARYLRLGALLGGPTTHNGQIQWGPALRF